MFNLKEFLGIQMLHTTVIKKRSERRDHRVDTERRREHSVGKVKVGMQRRNWCNENVKNRENERQHQQ